MDAISILNRVKNKVLDAKNFDILKRTYNLQNENIEQLNTSNTAFKESNERLQEEVNGLKMENESLKQTVAELTQRVSQLDGDRVSSGLSDVELAILELYRERSTEPLYKEAQIVRPLISNFSRIQIESGIDDLVEAKMIEYSHAKSDLGTVVTDLCDERYDEDDIAYSLTKQGRKHLVQLGPG